MQKIECWYHCVASDNYTTLNYVKSPPCDIGALWAISQGQNADLFVIC